MFRSVFAKSVRLLLGLIVACLFEPALSAEDTGAQLYKAQCANCHGESGEGTSKFKRRLEGDLSVAQLADLIRETMPEDNPGSLTLEQARSIAEFSHQSFYSNIARERNRQVRIELARLTVRQYRNTTADLINSFRWTPRWGDQRGLKAEYFKGRRFNRESRVVERIDPQVNFDFGTEAPIAEQIEPHEFSMRWAGSLLAPETGEYDIVVYTEHAARLWINDPDPVIDAWVKSGTDTEYKASVFLVAGRMYSLKLEFSKAKQGVDDSKNQKQPPPSKQASIKLLWRTPQGVLEPVPSRLLSTEPSPGQYICSTPFPPDDRSYGWERGTSVSKEWDQATTSAAIDVAGYATRWINELAGTRDEDGDRTGKIRSFARRFAERALRRPLTEEQAQILVNKQFDAVPDPLAALKRTIVLTLKSPEFLYREIGNQTDTYAVASRLSYGLWDSLPDEELLKAAAQGRLSTPEQVGQQAERMLGDLRTRDKLRRFLLTWLKADGAVDLTKDSQQFPGFDSAAIADLHTSLELFLDDVVWSESSDYRRLLVSDEVYLNERLAKFYGTEPPLNGEFLPVRFEPERRAGVLTHPYLLARFAHTAESSPIHRGVFLTRGVLGQALRAPPEAVAPLAADLHPTLTTRERVTLQTKAASCMSCHSTINQLGFTLEHFDAVGRYREQDRNQPVNAHGSYRTREGDLVELNGARTLAQFLADSPEAHNAFVEQLFHHLVQQSMQAYGPAVRENLNQKFTANGYHIRKLAVDILAASALTGRDTQVAAAP